MLVAAARADAPTLSPGSVVPAPGGAVTWRKRSHGISAGQMYDLTQSPLLRTLYGCGFQDNGRLADDRRAHVAAVLGADGGFTAFDPDDPYRVLAT